MKEKIHENNQGKAYVKRSDKKFTLGQPRQPGSGQEGADEEKWRTSINDPIRLLSSGVQELVQQLSAFDPTDAQDRETRRDSDTS